MPFASTKRLALAALVAATLAAGWALFWPRDPVAEATGEQPVDLATALAEQFLDEDAPPLSGPWELSLPRDHLSHPEAASETWGVTAHLQDATGAPLSLFFSITRFALANAGQEPSAWTMGEAWAAQVSVAGASIASEERLSRGAGAAGSSIEEGSVWVDDWSLAHAPGPEGGTFTIRARIDGSPLSMTLAPRFEAISALAEADAPSRGFAIPRLQVRGGLGDEDGLTGTAWLDRLWGAVPGPGGPLIFDRMVLHLDTGAALTLLQSRRRDGRGGATLDALIVAADGSTRSPSEGAVSLQNSGEDGWRITGSGLDLYVGVIGSSDGAGSTLPFRHMALAVSGTLDGADVTGAGTFLVSVEDGT